MTMKRRALADRRKAVGLTQEQLAALLGVERSTVVRWEAGETEPLPWCRPRLAQALGVSLDMLHGLLTSVDDVLAHSPDAVLLSLLGDVTSTEIGTLMERFSAMDVASRREVLQELTIISGTILLQPVRRWLAQALAIVPLMSPESVGSDALDALERSAMLFRRWDASGVGGLRRKAVVGQLNALAESLSESHSPAVTRRLFEITAELAQLAGWMAYDQGLPGVAQRYYLLGLGACQEAKSPMLGAKILGDMTQLSTAQQHYDDSLDLVRTALYILPRHDSALVRTELLGLESRVHAHLGNDAQAASAAEACVEVWQSGHSEEIPDWLHYMNKAEVDCLAANTYIELALRATSPVRAATHAERAEQCTLSARADRADGYNRSRILDEIRLAKVRLAQDDLTECVTVAEMAVELAAPTSSIVVCDWLLRFHGELTARYPHSMQFAPLSENMREYVKRVAPHREKDIAVT
jgi:transcriptional regulator with XRE-family HTH domain